MSQRNKSRTTVESSNCNYLFILCRRKRKINCLRLGMGILAVAFLAVLVTVAVAKLMPNTSKNTSTAVKKGGQFFQTWFPSLFSSSIYIDIQEVVFKAVFSTDYISVNETQSLTVTNLDEITNQVWYFWDSGLVLSICLLL